MTMVLQIIMHKGVQIESRYRGVFSNLPELEELTIADASTKLVYSMFPHNENLKKVTLPEGYKTIPYNCFNGCVKLSDVNIPDSVEEIDEYAFCHCPIKTLNLKNVKSIGYFAFAENSAAFSGVLCADMICTSNGTPYSFSVLTAPDTTGKSLSLPIITATFFILKPSLILYIYFSLHSRFCQQKIKPAAKQALFSQNVNVRVRPLFPFIYDTEPLTPSMRNMRSFSRRSS